MAKEYASAGITVNAHCPGVVGTDMWVTIDERFSEVTGAPKGQTYQQFVDGIAFGRAQTPADVAAFVPYLAGPDSDSDWAGRPHRRGPSLPVTTENLRPPHRTTGTHRVRRNHDAPRVWTGRTSVGRPPTPIAPSYQETHMKAARYFDRGDIRIEDVAEPEVQPGTVGVDVAWCGICGTDLHEYLDGPIFVPPAGHPHPVSGESAPITLGHEMSGTIYAIGEDVTDLKVGDNVVVEPYIIDPKESTEPGSNYHLTPNMNFIGLAGRGGGLGEKIVVERRWIHPIGDIALDEAALIEPLAVGYHAFVRSGAKPGDIALIGGAGPIGLLTAAVLKANGVTVIMSELSPMRRQKALDTQVADHALNPAEVDVVEEVKRLSGGTGADVAFECSSVNVVLDTLFDAVRPGGVIVVVAIWGHPAQLDLQKLVLKEVDMRGTIAYMGNHPDVIKLVQDGKIDLKPFITGKIALDNLVDEGFDTLIHRNDTAVKILVSPSGRGL